mmetsp:Transcript_17205/g.43993  ORF Transcript_17205/g.43993 Transcript_17205/m.43993 type:complete len:207 (+) Transcript_17205:203-823(+)
MGASGRLGFDQLLTRHLTTFLRGARTIHASHCIGALIPCRSISLPTGGRSMCDSGACRCCAARSKRGFEKYARATTIGRRTSACTRTTRKKHHGRSRRAKKRRGEAHHTTHQRTEGIQPCENQTRGGSSAAQGTRTTRNSRTRKRRHARGGTANRAKQRSGTSASGRGKGCYGHQAAEVGRHAKTAKFDEPGTLRVTGCFFLLLVF